MILAGIDEAGYGPRLGPLVVASNAFRTSGTPDEGSWPACRIPCAGTTLRICDSKAAYSGSKGLAALERVVLAFAAHGETCPATLKELLDRWAVVGGAEALARPWYSGDVVRLPQAVRAAEVVDGRRVVAAALGAGGYGYLGAMLAVVDETRFNGLLGRTGNKAVLLFGQASILMRRLWEEYRGEGVYLTVDRHGGRKFYAGLLDIAFPEAAIRKISENSDESSYVLEDGRGRMFVRFKVRAESEDSGVALSSMWAKYARELFMRAFNDYWMSRAEGLRPTAGYWVDAERFIADLASANVVTPADAAGFTRLK